MEFSDRELLQNAPFGQHQPRVNFEASSTADASTRKRSKRCSKKKTGSPKSATPRVETDDEPNKSAREILQEAECEVRQKTMFQISLDKSVRDIMNKSAVKFGSNRTPAVNITNGLTPIIR